MQTRRQAQTQKRSRILVVDRQPSVRDLLRERLSRLGFEVVEAPSVEIALVKIASISFELIISDIQMSGQSGIDLLKKIKKMEIGAEVIIMTDSPSLESSLEATRLGAYDYLVKPFEDLEYLESVVGRALAQKTLKIENQTLIGKLAQQNEEVTQGNERAADILVETTRFYKIETNILKSKNKDELVKYLEEGLRLLSKGKPAIIWFYHHKQGTLEAYKTIELKNIPLPPISFSHLASISEDEAALWLSNEDYKVTLNQALEVIRPKTQLSQPMIYQNKWYGLITILNRRPEEWALHEKNSLAHMCLLAATKLSGLEAADKISENPASGDGESTHQQIKVRDTITPLLNFDYFLEYIKLEVARSRRYRHTFTLLMLTFKPSTDPEKDPIFRDFIQAWGESLAREIRTTDFATRKRNKFFIVLPETDVVGSKKVTQSLEDQIEQSRHAQNNPDGRWQGIIGSVEYPKDGDTPEALVMTLKKRIKNKP